MPFQKGQSGNPSGRPKGSENKYNLEARAFARKVCEDKAYRANVRRRMIDGTAGQLETLLWHYAYGKPKVEVDVGGLLEFTLAIGDENAGDAD